MGQALSQEAGKQWGKIVVPAPRSSQSRRGVHTGTSRHLKREVGKVLGRTAKGAGPAGREGQPLS